MQQDIVGGFLEKIEYENERIDPDKAKGTPSMEKHAARYHFAKKYVRGKRVIDVGCGPGYGSDILASAGAEIVVGIDNSEKGLSYAREKYGRENLEFKLLDCMKTGLENSEFDVAVSFELIEHLDEDEQKKSLSEIKRLLKPGGLLIISTPNKRVYKIHIPAHKKEMDLEEFSNILGNYFSETEMFGQYYMGMVQRGLPLPAFVKRLIPKGVKADYAKKNPQDFSVRKMDLDRAMHFVAVSKKGTIL
jgi:2-polyprenyl-3-methyl-5-hydroxy-6-metoxy-1,4-benzoquinol methylase